MRVDIVRRFMLVEGRYRRVTFAVRVAMDVAVDLLGPAALASENHTATSQDGVISVFVLAIEEPRQ